MTDRICSNEGCASPARSLGLCSRCYDRTRRKTSRRYERLKGATVAEKIVSNHIVSPEGCWRWQGALRRGGYGTVWDTDRTRAAHRVAYEVAFGPIPEGLTIDHVLARGCVHRDCVNPAHLEAVTMKENSARAHGAYVRCDQVWPIVGPRPMLTIGLHRIHRCSRCMGHKGECRCKACGSPAPTAAADPQ